ncbi:prepilin peptidase [Corynebacterium sp. CNCTC7651]|nr:prepilin peptidase [Corynebacterium sp. CNCTC7651]
MWGILALVWSAGLMLFDVRFNRLPDFLTLPAFIPALAMCVDQPWALMGLVWPTAYLVHGTGIGGGDIKLAVPLGIAAAWCAGMAGMLLAVMLSSLLSVLAGVAMRRQTVPHGPAMLVATWTVVAVAGVPV